MAKNRNIGSAVAVSRKHFPTIPAAIKALGAMAKQLDSAKNFDAIKKFEQAAEAFKTLFADVDEVKHAAEIIILDARARIGEELEKVPKATGRVPKNIPRGEGLKKGRAATGIPAVSRSRLKKLAALGKTKRHAIARELQKAGKDATVKAVLGEMFDEEIKAKRKAFEKRRGRGQTVEDLDTLIAEGKTFAAMLLDPAWDIKTYSEKGKTKSAQCHYDTMTLEQIKALPIPQLAAKDCTIFMWAVWMHLPGALDLLSAWGFKFKTVAFVWLKTTKNATAITFDGTGIVREGDGLHWGLGYWTRGNTEVCIVATKGAPKRLDRDIHQVIVAPVGEHSQKPECVHAKIEALVLGPYLEMFARKPVPGWTCWGNEIEKGESAAPADPVATAAAPKRSHKKKPPAEPVPQEPATDASESVEDTMVAEAAE